MHLGKNKLRKNVVVQNEWTNHDVLLSMVYGVINRSRTCFVRGLFKIFLSIAVQNNILLMLK